MGCAGSKLDDLEAVALCRERSNLLADAISHRYALAEAHAAYIHSLRSVGVHLHRFFDGHDLLPPPSPILHLPAQRKGSPPAPAPPPISAADHSRSHSYSSNSGSHLHFHSDDSDSDDDMPLHSDNSSPLHHVDGPVDMGPTTSYIHYARKAPPAASSVTYEQHPMAADATVQYSAGEPSSSSSSSYPAYYAYPPYPNQNPPTNYYNNPYPSYPPPYSYPPPAYSPYGGAMGGAMGGFFGSSPPPVMAAAPPPEASPSSSQPPPPPPSPPRASTWDFLNPFGSFENYYPPYTPSRSSKEVREEEGIPDLEEEEHEVVKEAYGDEKKKSSSKAAAVAMAEEDGRRSVGGDPHYQPPSSGAGEGRAGVEYDVHPVVDKNVVADESQRQPTEGGDHRKVVPGSRGISEVVQEIKAQFELASNSCDEVSKMLEVGKLPYHRRKYEVVSAKMMGAIGSPLSQPLSSKIGEPSTSAGKGDSVYMDFEEEKGMKSGNLSSTLEKLYIWEKKLYEEVRAEEKMRVLHDRKCRRLKHLDETGAESHKLDSTQTLVRKLSTKIRIAIQVVDSISNKINKLRDEELWPQLNELIQGLVRMWKVMLECHQRQCQAIVEAKNLDAISSNGKLSDAHMEVTVQLELEILNWISTFSDWVFSQKCFVKALNGWLLKCLHYEPEETADGIVPFSPGRLGAPPIFIICNNWSQAMDRISEMEVFESMQAFATSMLQLCEQHNAQSQIMKANRDIDRKREEQKIHKAVDAVNKKLVLVSGQSGLPFPGQIMLHSHTSEVRSLHSGLKQIFEAMERYADSSMKTYEDLRSRCEEERTARENMKVS